MIEFSAQQIATLLGGKIIGDQNRKVSDVGPLESAREGQLSFLCEEKYLPQLETTNASVVLLSSGLRDAAETLPTRYVLAAPLKTHPPFLSCSRNSYYSYFNINIFMICAIFHS